jgi:hypothetical protein
MKLGDFRGEKSAYAPQIPGGEIGPISKVTRHEPSGWKRGEPSLDPQEDNPLTRITRKIDEMTAALKTSRDNVSSLDLYEAQQTLENLRTQLDNMIDALNKARMAGWGGATGLGNPWAENRNR